MMNAVVSFAGPKAAQLDPEQLAAAFDVCPEGLAVAENARILRANLAFARLFGYRQSSEVCGRALADFLPQDCLRTPIAPAGSERNNAEREYPFCQFAGKRRNGTRAEMEAWCAPFRSGERSLLVIAARGVSQGEPRRMVEDVTEPQPAEPQLHQAQKMEAIGRLVGGVAHDFNNLLTGVMLYCDLLRAGLESGSRLRRHVEDIRMAAEQGAALIQQLLAVARQQVVEPRVLSLNQVVSGMRNLLARLIGENIELVTKLAADLGSVKMDPAQAQQIILNLVLNARDAMPEGGRVTLETRNCGEDEWPRWERKPAFARGVVLSVGDTGSGMDAETRSRLFQPFFTTKRPGRGSGMGLATVHGAVQQCGGDIQVQSEPGKGTKVYIMLPRVESEIAGQPDTQSAASAQRREGSALRRKRRKGLHQNPPSIRNQKRRQKS
jgi:PAS domain S-box-containing protein